jgi:hypothetical protein
VRRRLGALGPLSGPISQRAPAAKHDGVDILAEHGVYNSLLLEQRALGLCLARGVMYGEAKQANKTLTHSGSYSVAAAGGALVALEGGLVGAIENKDWVDGEAEEANEAVE